MSFTLQTWQEKFKANLADWKQRMLANGGGSIYAFLASSALLPVAQAIREGDRATLLAIGGVLASVGANLIANRLEAWKSEAEAAVELEAALPEEPDLRAELDAILEKLDALPLARQALAQKEHEWFAKTLRTELQRLGNLSRFEAVLTGSGALAIGKRAKAAGKRAVVADQIQNSTIITGDYNIIAGVYQGPAVQNHAAALDIYRRVLISSCRHLPLRGVEIGASDPTQRQQRIDLAQVYVDLETTARIPPGKKEKKGRKQEAQLEERDTRPLGVLEAAIQNHRLVILGDPGSGKSTFINHLALCLACHGREPEAGWLERLRGWPAKEATLVPITIVLRDFSRWLPENVKQAEPQHLWNFITGRLAAQKLDFVAEPLHAALEQGRAIVLLDGLDEIPTNARRTLMRDAVAIFAERYNPSRFVVTCRKLSYQDAEWQLPGFPEFTLAKFSEEKIARFIHAWYEELMRIGALKPEESGPLAQRLQAAIQERPDLKRLAPNPLLLTVMALVHAHKGRLPDTRAQLYEDTVDMLLWRWEEIKLNAEQEAPVLRQLLKQAERNEVDLKRVLWRLAFEAHGRGGASEDEALADVSEHVLEKALAGLHPQKSRDWAMEVIEAIKGRAGLLLERTPEVYTFPHRTFQEYLAGAHLSNQAQFARDATQLAESGPLWREAILLAVGRLVYVSGDTDKPLSLVAELCPEKAKDDELGWRKAWLAGEALLEVGLNRVQESSQGRDLASRVRRRLADLLAAGRLSAVERSQAGNSLARLSDSRFRSDAWFLPDEPLLGFVEIPAGEFLMGSDKKKDKDAYDDEYPQHKVTLPAFYIARYPVTVTQFQAFVEDSKHQPNDPRCLSGLPNHPVVYVTWHEAMAYCDWLTEKLRTWPQTPQPLATLLQKQKGRIILPSEAEWEKAARGPSASSGDGRIYPWGDKPDSNAANYDDTGIGATSPVGCFPAGVSPYGCWDMSGNVWEWTRSVSGNYPYPDNESERKKRERLDAPDNNARVVRGGAFYFNRGGVRCAYRDGDLPNFWDYYIGFRVAALPLL